MVNRNSLWRDGLRQAETETKMVWPCLKVFWFSRDNPVGHSERKKKKGRHKKRLENNIKEWTAIELPSQPRFSDLSSEILNRRPISL